MLVLSRKVGEKIHIGGNIILTIIEIGANKVRIGVDAPNNVPVYRSEVIQREGTEKLRPLIPLIPDPNHVSEGHHA